MPQVQTGHTVETVKGPVDTTELGQTLQCPSSGIEHELLFPGFHQGAGPEAVHDGRRTTGA